MLGKTPEECCEHTERIKEEVYLLAQWVIGNSLGVGIQISELLGQEGLDLRIILNGFNGLKLGQMNVSLTDRNID